ncbi:MAG: helix-turn-helix domain-containing protein [bacterium]
MDIKPRIGKRIKQLRAEAGISQMELANLAGLDRTYITSVENGRRNVSIVNIERIAKALNVTLKQFFDHAEFD